MVKQPSKLRSLLARPSLRSTLQVVLAIVGAWTIVLRWQEAKGRLISGPSKARDLSDEGVAKSEAMLGPEPTRHESTRLVDITASMVEQEIRRKLNW